jgi:hypothetical protein
MREDIATVKKIDKKINTEKADKMKQRIRQ